ncbi:hypothetical protein NGB78_07900 [Staphylococcus arlettae]|nr:hypothetical protein [Staphylococcus arlettae]MCD8833910.1 hypothetical protein [Staphylococcus arlettae]MEB7422005.1 hypothetical protein [Staphylococcus arlettae]
MKKYVVIGIISILSFLGFRFLVANPSAEFDEFEGVDHEEADEDRSDDQF